MQKLGLLCLGMLLCVVSETTPAKADPLAEFQENVQQLLMRNEFEKLDAMAAEFRRTDARFVGGHSKLYHFYPALGAIKASSEKCACAGVKSAFAFEEKEHALKTWLTERPQSVTARLALARLFIVYAWRGRGGSYSRDVSDEQWKLFRDRLQIASGYLKGLNPKDDPDVYAEYARLARDLGSRAALDKIYAAATRDFPQFFHIYADRAGALQEKWLGQPGELASYTQSLLSSPGGEDGQIAYTYVAGRLVTEFSRATVFEKTGVIWPLLKEAYRTREKRYGRSRADLRVLLTYAIAANDKEFDAELREKLRTVDDAPQMVHVEFRFLSPKIKPGSFESSIRKVWRSGDRYLRSEEAPDPQQHIHGVIIVNEPDVWMWNRFDNTAKHIVDPGPTHVVHDALFSGEPSKVLQGLEIGREKDFFSANRASPLPDEKVDGVDCTVQSLTVDDSTLTLYLRKSDGSPFQVSIKNPRDAYAVRYETYESRLALDPSLFVAPREAKISEAN